MPRKKKGFQAPYKPGTEHLAHLYDPNKRSGPRRGDPDFEDRITQRIKQLPAEKLRKLVDFAIDNPKKPLPKGFEHVLTPLQWESFKKQVQVPYLRWMYDQGATLMQLHWLMTQGLGFTIGAGTIYKLIRFSPEERLRGKHGSIEKPLNTERDILALYAEAIEALFQEEADMQAELASRKKG